MSAGRFVDANVFLRHVLEDNEQQTLAVGALFLGVIEGRERVWTTLTVVAEVVWVLSGGVYRHPKRAIRDAVEPLMMIEGLHIEGKQLLPTAFDYFTGLNIDFVDALTAAQVEQHDPTEIYSFDRDFDRIPGVRRIEPGR